MTAATIIEERLAALDTLKLDDGSHQSFEQLLERIIAPGAQGPGDRRDDGRDETSGHALRLRVPAAPPPAGRPGGPPTRAASATSAVCRAAAPTGCGSRRAAPWRL